MYARTAWGLWYESYATNFFLLLLLFCLPSQAGSLEKYKSNCTEMGFLAGTEKFGSCVLELSCRF